MSANVLALSQENPRFLSCHGQINRTSLPPLKSISSRAVRQRLLQAGGTIQMVQTGCNRSRGSAAAPCHPAIVHRSDAIDPGSAAQRSCLFYEFVGAVEPREREGNPQRLGGLEVDDQLDFGGLLDWQVGRLVAIENPAGIV